MFVLFYGVMELASELERGMVGEAGRTCTTSIPDVLCWFLPCFATKVRVNGGGSGGWIIPEMVMLFLVT